MDVVQIFDIATLGSTQRGVAYFGLQERATPQTKDRRMIGVSCNRCHGVIIPHVTVPVGSREP